MPRRASTNLWFQKGRVRVYPERRASDVGVHRSVVPHIEIEPRDKKLGLAQEQPRQQAAVVPAPATDWTSALKTFTTYYIDHILCKSDYVAVPNDVTAFFTNQSKQKEHAGGADTKVWWSAIQHYLGLCTTKNAPSAPAWKEIKKVCDKWLANLNPETSELWNLLLALGTVYLQCTSKPMPEYLNYWHYIHFKYVAHHNALSSRKPKPGVLKVNPEWVYMFRTFLDIHSKESPDHRALYRSLHMGQLYNEQLMTCMDLLTRRPT